MNAWITRGAVAINVFSFPPMCRRVSRTSRIRRLCPRCDRVYRFCEFCTSERSWNEYHYRIIYRKRSHIPSVRLVVIEKKRRKEGINGKVYLRGKQTGKPISSSAFVPGRIGKFMNLRNCCVIYRSFSFCFSLSPSFHPSFFRLYVKIYIYIFFFLALTT